MPGQFKKVFPIIRKKIYLRILVLKPICYNYKERHNSFIFGTKEDLRTLIFSPVFLITTSKFPSFR